MRTMDFDRVASSAPLDATAASVRDGSGDLYEVAIPAHHPHFRAPPLPLHRLQPGQIDYTGRRIGRLTVIRFHELRHNGGTKEAMWLVRCQCGDYELRRAKTIRRNANADACCYVCHSVNTLRERAAKPATKKDRRKAAALLDRFAAQARGAMAQP